MGLSVVGVVLSGEQEIMPDKWIINDLWASALREHSAALVVPTDLVMAVMVWWIATI